LPVVVLFIVAGLQVPVIPLLEEVGKRGATLPLQNGDIAANAGTMPGVTVTVKVVVVAHCPAFGVKVYVPVAVLFTIAGFQVPEIPFSEILFNTGLMPPKHSVAIAANVGVVAAFTATDAVVLLQVVLVLVKVKVAFPKLTPVITPPFVTVAIALLLLVHVPPVVGVSVPVFPTQTIDGDVTVGLGFTVTVTLIVSGQLIEPIEPEVTV
jgi:hypothetical protein